MLPYAFTRECQFNCAFCQTEGRQSHLPFDQAAREIDVLAERHGARDFFLVNTQINMVAAPFARALLAARVRVRWTDSFRVRPATEEDLDLMRDSGCVGLTVGVESASDAVLKRMMKGHRGEHATQFVRAAEAREMMLRVNLLPCFPGETAADFEETRRWVEENARFIDDLAPSAFYLTPGSPVGRDPARFGVALRDDRALRGEDRFRKQYDVLAYDEVGGMSWEEREPTLRTAETILRDAWRRGAPDRVRQTGIRPAMMLALRGAYPTKAALYADLARWSQGAPADPPSPTAPSAVTAPRALLAIGAFRVGALVEGWRVGSLAVDGEVLRVALAGETGAVTLGVAFSPAPPGKRSPFDAPRARVWYENTAVPFAAFRAAGMRVRDEVARATAEDPAAAWGAWRDGATWG